MNHRTLPACMTVLTWVLLLTVGLTACAAPKPTATALPPPTAAPTLTPAPTAAPPQPTATLPQPTATMPPTTTAEPTVVPTTPQPVPLPLSEPGPYYPGKRTFTREDASRDGRQVSITLWFPALLPAGKTGGRLPKLFAGTDRAPDLSGAPYPLILSSTDMARVLAPYLVSHGFTWASVDGIHSYLHMGEQMYSQPLDILFALDEVASNPPEELQGMIDAEHAGAIGYSFDGYNALVLSGARIDPAYYLAQCPKPDPTTEAILGAMSAYSCGPAGEWEEFAARAGEAITRSEDGLWQPITDPRIRAVMPMAGEGWWLFGERGLAAVDRPILMIVATHDELYRENVLIFDHLGTPDKALISFVGPDHMMVFTPEWQDRMGHFAVAFFGYHLQGKPEYRHYFSQDFVSRIPFLKWGVYAGM